MNVAQEAQPKLDKIQEKRQQQHLERRKRLIGKGIPENKVDAYMAQEDFNNLPLEKRIMMTMNGALSALASDIRILHGNHFALADAMDSNFRAMARILVKAGVPLEAQNEIIKEVEAEIRKEREEAEKAHKEEQQKQMEAAKAQSAQEALEAAESSKPEAVPEGPAVTPEGATTFGD